MDEDLILSAIFITLCYWALKKLVKVKKTIEPVTLGPGTYTAGEDIPVGKYDLIATAGTGDFCFRKKDQGDWAYTNSLSAEFPLHADRFRNIDLKKGDVLEINCNITVSATPASAIKDVTKETLSPGIYRFGVDVPPGKYNLEAVEGRGYAFTRQTGKEDETAYQFFQYMSKAHHRDAPTFANVKCEEKQELWVMGSLQLRLVEVPKAKKE